MAKFLTFREKMNLYDKESLKGFAAELFIKKAYQLKKADLIEKLTEFVLDPDNLFYRMSILDDRAMKLFEDGAKESIIVTAEHPELYETVCLLNELEIGNFDNSLYTTLSDVWEIYQNQVAGTEFDSYRNKASWIWKCLYWVENMYAYARMDIFLKVVNTKKGIHLTEAEVIDIYRHFPDDKLYVYLVEDIFIERNFAKNNDVLQQLHRVQADKEYYIPTATEIEEFYDTGALISKKTYQEMQRFLTKEMGIDKTAANNILLELWDQITAANDFHETMQWFLDQVIIKDKSLTDKLVGLYMSLSNDTNMLINRGYTPRDLPQPKSVKGQIPTIIPVSSQAAKLLSEAAPQLSQMGFNIDINGESKELPVINMKSGVNGPISTSTKKVYPNDPCPCGSGKKFKKCCGKNS